VLSNEEAQDFYQVSIEGDFLHRKVVHCRELESDKTNRYSGEKLTGVSSFEILEGLE